MWYEILPGFMVIAGAITFTGAGLRLIQYFECEGKPQRFFLDDYSRKMMKRDERITGSMYRQRVPDTDESTSS